MLIDLGLEFLEVKGSFFAWCAADIASAGGNFTCKASHPLPLLGEGGCSLKLFFLSAALACFKAWIAFTNHIVTATAFNYLTVWVAHFCALERA